MNDSLRAISLTPADATYCVIDVETTGLSVRTDRVLEIGCVLLDAQFNEVETWQTLVNPEEPVRATFVHGITDDDVAGAPTFAQIVPSLVRLLHGRIVVGHNVGFDVGFINAEFARAGALWPTETPLVAHRSTVCTLDQARIYAPDGSHSLLRLCQRLGIAQQQSHRALDDARLSAELLRWYVHQEASGQRVRNRAQSRHGTAVTPASWATAEPVRFAPPQETLF